MEVEIEYCVPCGHLERAIHTQRDLLQTFGNRLERVALRTGSGGVFKIRVADEQIWDAKTDGFDDAKIRDLVEQRLAA